MFASSSSPSHNGVGSKAKRTKIQAHHSFANDAIEIDNEYQRQQIDKKQQQQQQQQQHQSPQTLRPKTIRQCSEQIGRGYGSASTARPSDCPSAPSCSPSQPNLRRRRSHETLDIFEDERPHDDIFKVWRHLHRQQEERDKLHRHQSHHLLHPHILSSNSSAMIPPVASAPLLGVGISGSGTLNDQVGFVPSTAIETIDEGVIFNPPFSTGATEIHVQHRIFRLTSVDEPPRQPSIINLHSQLSHSSSQQRVSSSLGQRPPGGGNLNSRPYNREDSKRSTRVHQIILSMFLRIWLWLVGHVSIRRSTMLRLAGTSAAVVSSFFLAANYAISEYLEKTLDPIEIYAWRQTLLIFYSIPVAAYYEKPMFFKVHEWRETIQMILRSFAGSVSIIFIFEAVEYIPLADATVVSTAAPIFCSVMARIFLKEPFGPMELFCAILVMIGVTMNAQPTWILNPDLLNDNMKHRILGLLFAVGGALAAAGSTVLMRTMKKVHYSSQQLMYSYMSAAMTWPIVFILGYGRSGWPPCGYFKRIVVIAIGFTALPMQALLIYACQREKAGVVSIARSTTPFFALIFQITLFGVIPDTYSIIGDLIIMASILLLAIKMVLEPQTQGCWNSCRIKGKPVVIGADEPVLDEPLPEAILTGVMGGHHHHLNSSMSHHHHHHASSTVAGVVAAVLMPHHHNHHQYHQAEVSSTSSGSDEPNSNHHQNGADMSESAQSMTCNDNNNHHNNYLMALPRVVEGSPEKFTDSPPPNANSAMVMTNRHSTDSAEAADYDGDTATTTTLTSVVLTVQNERHFLQRLAGGGGGGSDDKDLHRSHEE